MLTAVLVLAAAVELGQPRCEPPAWNGDTVTPADLGKFYCDIFAPSNNRNAASHLWSNFLMEKASTMTDATFTAMMEGYCAVSGSPLTAQPGTRWKATFPKVGGGSATGFLYHCCSPCICDSLDFLEVDTKTMALKGGVQKQYNFLVIGNPCTNPNAIPAQAPAVTCAGSTLENAQTSDAGKIIIGRLFDDDGSEAQESTDMAADCKDRANNGYASGMGEIFRQVACIDSTSSLCATSLVEGTTSAPPAMRVEHAKFDPRLKMTD